MDMYILQKTQIKLLLKKVLRFTNGFHAANFSKLKKNHIFESNHILFSGVCTIFVKGHL